MVVEAAPPAVGPEPASREASSFVTFSISAVHCPASAVPMGKATRIQAPNINAVVFMALFSRLRLRKPPPRGFRRFDINRRNEPTFPWIRARWPDDCVGWVIRRRIRAIDVLTSGGKSWIQFCVVTNVAEKLSAVRMKGSLYPLPGRAHLLRRNRQNPGRRSPAR
jgi:hypothetical protein